MPIYEYKCKVCGRQYEEFHHIETREESFCCGEKAQKLISKNQARPVVIEYYSEMANAHFTGLKQKRRILREKNLEEVG